MFTDLRLDRQKKTIQRQGETIRELNLEIANLEREKMSLQNIADEKEAALQEAMNDLQQTRDDFLAMLSDTRELREKYKTTLLQISRERAEYRTEMERLLRALKKQTK